MAARDKKKFSAFSLVEVLVALSIIALASTSIVSVISHATKFMRIDKKLQQATRICDDYLSDVYMSTNIGMILFSTQDRIILKNSRLPKLLPPERIISKEGLLLLVNKKVRKINPLLVDIGLEVVWKSASTNQKSRQYWIETTISENYLMSMK